MSSGFLSRALARTGLGAVRYRLTGHRMPLAVTLMVTHRCDALCVGCRLPLVRRDELSTEEWVAVIDELARAGTIRVGFTGGEPLMRADIGALIDRCSSREMWTTLETNGYRYPERRGELGTLGRVMFALDGPEAVHDAQREPGAFRKVMRAIEAAAEDDADRWTVTTLTAQNLDHLDWIVDQAERWGCTAAFQVLSTAPAIAPRSAARLAPGRDALRRALRGLLEARLAGRPVGVSEKALRYLLTWDDPRISYSCEPHEDVHCMAGQLHCAVAADGVVVPCTTLAGLYPGRSVRDGGFEAAFQVLRDNACRSCTSVPLTEYNYLYNLNGPALVEWGQAMGRSLARGKVPEPKKGAA